jgi:hypothetical protein
MIPKLNHHGEALLQEFRECRPSLEKLSDKVCTQLRQALKTQSIELMGLEHRVKTEDSLAGKLERKGDKYATLEQLTDLVGVRIITYYTDDVDKVAAIVQQLFEVVINMQSHDDGPDMLSLFNDDEIYDMWSIQNVGWYQNYGPSPYTDGIMPFSQFNLLTNIIETADTCVALGKTQATLRFGHEVCVMPLACLMELGTCGVQVSDMEQFGQVMI